MVLLAALQAGCALLAEPAVAPEPGGPEPPAPLEDCSMLTILVDTSRRGDPEIGARARRAMASELERFGARITDSPRGAYWSLMILASQNSRRDGFIVSALLSARTVHEGFGPGMTVFSRENDLPQEQGSDGAGGPEAAAGDGPAPPAQGPVPTLYNGIAFGPWRLLESQARALARQAYTAVYPAARRLCEVEAAERLRERELEEQLPPPPEPL